MVASCPTAPSRRSAPPTRASAMLWPGWWPAAPSRRRLLSRRTWLPGCGSGRRGCAVSCATGAITSTRGEWLVACGCRQACLSQAARPLTRVVPRVASPSTSTRRRFSMSYPGGTHPVAVVSACMRSDGIPDFALTEVEVTPEQAENGIHYYIVEAHLLEAGYEEHFVHFEDLDGPAFLFCAVSQ